MPLQPSPTIRLPVNVGRVRPKTDHPVYWHPSRVDAQLAPPWFRRRLHEIDPHLELTWNPITERWQAWAPAPKIQHSLCPGWKLLFIHHGATQQYLPLDERVFARIYQVSALHQNVTGKQYFERICAEMDRDHERQERQNLQDTIDLAMPSWEHGQIKVSGCGPSNGSKFSTYHA